MARRAASDPDSRIPAQKAAHPILRAIHIGFTLAVCACALVGCIWATVRVEQFVVTDKQFLLQGPPEPGVASEFFLVDGIVHASEQRIIDVFAKDFGRSIYLCPIEERRRRLLAIDWIRDATVSRVWPNRVIVRVVERVPVAFVQVPAADGTMVYALVDEDGVLLDPQNAAKLALPVLSGVPGDDPEALRRERVRRFLRLQTEFGKLMDKVSEIDVSDVENLKITQEFNGRALTLMLGNQKFLQRYQNFINNHEEIRKRLPDAPILDLRLKDRITAVGPAEPAPGGSPLHKKEVRRR